MKINQNKVVLLHYELSVNGKSVEKNDLDYIHGTHMLLPKFEQELEGLEPTQSFAFTLSPEEGYGTYEADKRINLSKSAFMVDGRLMEEFLKPGQLIPMLDGAGQVVQGLVCEVKEDAVTMDFNHPMAGKTLHFEGVVKEVREATEKELKEGLHGEFLPPEEHHCCHKHGNGGCCHHGEGHDGEHECCHHGEGHKDGECCHGDGGHEGGCCHQGGKDDAGCCQQS